MSSPDSIADAAFIAFALNALKFWSFHEGKCMGITDDADCQLPYCLVED